MVHSLRDMIPPPLDDSGVDHEEELVEAEAQGDNLMLRCRYPRGCSVGWTPDSGWSSVADCVDS